MRSLLNDEQMSNWVGVKHLPVMLFFFCHSHFFLFSEVIQNPVCFFFGGRAAVIDPIVGFFPLFIYKDFFSKVGMTIPNLRSLDPGT